MRAIPGGGRPPCNRLSDAPPVQAPSGPKSLSGWLYYVCPVAERRRAVLDAEANKLVAFDRNRRVMVTMAENVERATRPELAELVQLLVERVTASGRTVEPESIEWTPPARPFFEPAALLWRPRTVLGNRRRTTG